MVSNNRETKSGDFLSTGLYATVQVTEHKANPVWGKWKLGNDTPVPLVTFWSSLNIFP